MSSCTTTHRDIYVDACPMHHASDYGQLQHFVASWMFSRTEFLLLAGRRPNTQLPSANLKAKAKALRWGKSSPWEHLSISATPSQPHALTLEVPLLHFHMSNTVRPLIQISYSWKQYYSSKARAIIFAMTTEKERHHCPKAMFCCSKNDERSPRGVKVWLSWPRYRHALSIWHTNNAMLVEKGRYEELYLNFTMFT